MQRIDNRVAGVRGTVNQNFLFLIVVLDSVALFYLGKKITELKDNQNSLLYGGLILNAIFMVLFTIVLPGGVYLFMIPLLTANIVLHLIHLLKKKHIGSQRVYVIMESINIIIPLVLFAPIIYLLYLALTIGALAICTMFLVFPFAIVIPTIERLNKI